MPLHAIRCRNWGAKHVLPFVTRHRILRSGFFPGSHPLWSTSSDQAHRWADGEGQGGVWDGEGARKPLSMALSTKTLGAASGFGEMLGLVPQPLSGGVHVFSPLPLPSPNHPRRGSWLRGSHAKSRPSMKIRLKRAET